MESGTGQEEEGCQPCSARVCVCACVCTCVRQDGRDTESVKATGGRTAGEEAARKAGGEVTFGQAWEEAGPPGERDAGQRTAARPREGLGPGRRGRRPREAEPRLGATAGLLGSRGREARAPGEDAGSAATDRSTGLRGSLRSRPGAGEGVLVPGDGKMWPGGWEHSPRLAGTHAVRRV